MPDASPLPPSPREQAIAAYGRILQAAADKGPVFLHEARRQLAKADLFFLLVFVLRRRDLNRDWLFDRCREVQAQPDDHLDLWARGHYKSTIVTFGLTIFEIIRDPEITIGIFSDTNKVAKAFLRQIKTELEINADLKALFPDVLWAEPRKQAPKWSEDDGITVKRRANPKEATVEAYGLLDGQPTGRHFRLRVYDDVVTVETVGTTEQIEKVTERLALSDNLGSENGRKRYIGTHYHAADSYVKLLATGTVRPRIYPATDDGTETGEPVLLSRDELAKKRRSMGPYVFACFPAGTPILMADWTERDISQIRPGDQVVGWVMDPGKKARLVQTTVQAVRRREAETIRATMASGRIVECTPDHLWYTGRRPGGTHKTYLPLGFDKAAVKGLISVYDRAAIATPHNQRAAAYLGGIFDGEGTVSGAALHIAQCERTNPAVCNRIRSALSELDFDWHECRPTSRPQHVDFVIRGGRASRLRFLRWCQPAKAPAIVRSMFEHGTRDFGKSLRDDLKTVHDTGSREVWTLETGTGNYIAWGYAAKNCQMLLDPRADRLSGFREEWLRFWDAQSTEGLNLYLIVDPSSGKKQKEQAKSKRGSLDYTSMWIVGIGADENLYVVDGLRDRLNLTARTKAVFDFHRRYRPQKVGYEQYGMQADIEHIRDVQDRENYRFDIVELGGALAKQDRIRRLVPLFEQRRIFLPRTLTKYATDGAAYDLTRVFIETEYLNFPVSEHDDMLDCLARMTETEALSIRAPAATTPTQRARDYSLDDQQADPFAWMTA